MLIKRLEILEALLLLVMLSGCAGPLKIDYNPSGPPPVRAGVRASILVEPLKDGRGLSKSPFNDPRVIGRITATVFDLRSDRLTLSEDPAALTTAAVMRELKDAGFIVKAHEDAGPADYVLTGELRGFRLDIVERDEVSIEAALVLVDAKTDKAVWAGTASVNDSRFAGVMGNTRRSISEYLEASLSRAIRGALPGIAAAAAASPPPAPAEPQNASNGRLMVTSVPQGAKVYIKGVYQGLTPVTVGLEPGVYEVTLKMKGFREIKEEVSVRANETTELPEDLEKE